VIYRALNEASVPVKIITRERTEKQLRQLENNPQLAYRYLRRKLSSQLGFHSRPRISEMEFAFSGPFHFHRKIKSDESIKT
jgi:hypothetical protein